MIKRLIPNTLRSKAWQHLYNLRDRSLQVVTGGATTEKLIALSFDDGPTATFTPQVLAALAQQQVPATFFMIGDCVTANPAIAREVASAGHAIGNHTATHRRLVGIGARAVAHEIRQCQRVIRESTGVNTHHVRPPFGLRDVTAHLVIRALGFELINWSASGDDWRGDDATTLANRVIDLAQPGGIVLLHDGCGAAQPMSGISGMNDVSDDRMPTVQALPILIDRLRRDGYRFVTVPQLLGAAPAIKQAWF